MQKLLEIIARLRHPDDGCAWDLQQTFSSIVPHTLEEVYELVEAIESENLNAIKDELGDVLFQVLILSKIAEDDQKFALADVVEHLSAKLIRRHPHVFTKQKFSSAAEHQIFWEEIKRKERGQASFGSNADQSILDGISTALPALVRAPKLQRRAASLGFDWENIDSIFAKLDEEIAELRAELGASDNKQRIEEEMGDVLLVCTNLARHLEVHSETALRKANQRFETRFRYVESQLSQQGQRVSDQALSTLQGLWEQAKQQQKGL
ncbi:Nucleoside triphosphate pyrophosphohydrolase MazG [hydrothermal vent metagenome]|uniref:Nucleoside triphosphate pyrophosphohydrolase MazG n=1 Tax=hydrothermal vent metagenome TaxID=652676 RepID=A0A3B0Z8G6_9ZZZZ